MIYSDLTTMIEFFTVVSSIIIIGFSILTLKLKG